MRLKQRFKFFINAHKRSMPLIIFLYAVFQIKGFKKIYPCLILFSLESVSHRIGRRQRISTTFSRRYKFPDRALSVNIEINCLLGSRSKIKFALRTIQAGIPVNTLARYFV